MKKYGRIFDNAFIAQDLKRKSVQGGLGAGASELLTQILRMASIVIFARILLPEHFGLVAMVMAVTAFAERLKHLGLSAATIQQREITHEQVSTLFWINAGAGGLIALLIAGLSPLIAWFYHEPVLVWITDALALTFLFGGLSVQHEALLRRQLSFLELAWVRILSNLFSIVLGIVLAINGFTYWALVWKEVARAAFEALGQFVVCRWWPSLPSFHCGIGSLLRFGRDMTISEFIYMLSRTIDQLLLGRFSGAHALGLYKQALQLIVLPMALLSGPASHTGLSSLSALQDQPDRYLRYYRKILAQVSFVSIPLATYLVIFSEDIVRLVLGEKWGEVTIIFKVLAIGALVEPLYSTCGWGLVMITQNKIQRLLGWNILHAAALVTGFSIGVYWGPLGVAISYTVTTYLLLIPSLYWGFKDTPVSMKLFFQAISMPAVSSCIMGMALLFLVDHLGTFGVASRLAISVLAAVTIYLGLWVTVPAGRKQLLEDAAYLLSILRPVQSVSR